MMASKINHGPEFRRPLNGTGVLRISELASKSSLKMATWNTRSLLQPGKIANVLQEMERINIDILGLSETKWPGTKKFISNDHHIFCSGGEDNTKQTYGVAFAIHKQLANRVISFTPVSERIALLQLVGNKINLNVLQVYAPTADKDDVEIESFYDQLSNTLKSLKKHDIVVILGDFNAKVGQGKLQNIVGEHGLGTRNERGDRLIQFCQEEKFSVINTWFKLPPRRLYTWTSPQDSDHGVVRNQIDYILINIRYRSSILNAKTYPGADISSDHNPVTATLRLKLRSVKSTRTTRRIDLEKLRDKTNRQQVQLHLNTAIRSIEAATTDVQAFGHSLKQCINETAETLLGHQTLKRKQRWMTEHILGLMDERRTFKNNRHQEKYKEVQQKIKQEIRRAKEKWMEDQCTDIEILIKKNDNFNLHKRLREAGGIYKSTPIPSLYTDDNQLILSRQVKLDTWENYIYNMFSANRKPVEEQQWVQDDSLHILASEVEHAIRIARPGKACGPDQIYVELLKQLDYNNIQQLTKWFNRIYNSGDIPADWLQSIFVTLPKKVTSRKCEDFRLISLMSQMLKVFLKVIQQRIRCKCENALGSTQFGFCNGLGTREAIFCLQVLLQRCYEHRREVYICFIDYERAFDSVDHDRLIDRLRKVGLEGSDINFITALYWNQTARLRYDDDLTNSIPIQKGVRQGCPLSPILFNIYSEIIFHRTLTDRNIGIQVNGHYINNLRYADDTALIADSEQDLQTILNEVDMESQKWGLRINKKKTKVMKVSRTPSEIKIKLNGEKLEQVHRFKYLGVLIDDQLNHETEIRSRIEQARQVFIKWKSLLTDRGLNTMLKLRTMKCYIWSVLLYGVETWTLTMATIKRLEAFEVWLYRRMLKIPWTAKITNTQVLQDMHTDRALLKTIISRKCKYLGHIVRNHQKYFLLPLVLEGKIKGKKRPGRPKRAWLDNINTWLHMTTAQTLHTVLDREQYRIEVANAIRQH